jgi:hypothetical protein
MAYVDVAGLDKRELVKALWVNNGGKPELFPSQYRPGQYVDYLGGISMKVDTTGDRMRADLYDRDTVGLTLQQVVRQLRDRDGKFPEDMPMEARIQSALLLDIF